MKRWREADLVADMPAIDQIWREIGWLEDASRTQHVASYYAGGDTIVADVDGRVECAVVVSPGVVAYQSERLSMAVVAAVTTSHVGRKRGLATELTAAVLARAGASGYAVSGLGMFEQGYYDRFGFGTMGYESMFRFDPADLRIDTPFRAPVRLTLADSGDMHSALLRRQRGHGGVSIEVPETFHADLAGVDDWFGLGYRDGERLSHFVVLKGSDEHGPYRVRWLAYENTTQLMELMALIASLGEQVRTVVMEEPAELQLQDLIHQPIRHRILTRGGDHAGGQSALAYWQMRILDLPACLARTHLPGADIAFNLVLTDPLAALLPDDAPWRGCAGEWLIRIGANSSAVPGADTSLPTLQCGVGTFTRLWMGVRPASVLANSEAMEAPGELIQQLDQQLRLPTTRSGYEF
ncbi:MAG: GNAT family N-acetyltransferase [Pseudomonadaceae bacterium]|nr:GNAT family N-acetyltransferase [Pseudomonadaceae bacterium]